MGEEVVMTKYFKLKSKQSHRLQAYNLKNSVYPKNNVLQFMMIMLYPVNQINIGNIKIRQSRKWTNILKRYINFV